MPLTRNPNDGLHAYKQILPAPAAPRTERTPRPEQGSHEGHEWLYVLSGRLLLALGEHDLVLTAGQTAEFDTRVPHGIANAGDRPVEWLARVRRCDYAAADRRAVRCARPPVAGVPRPAGLRPGCYPSAITTADAIPASWLSDTCQDATPSSAARSATVPVTRSLGRPPSSTYTSASVHSRPAGAPSALASASFAAKRAASEAVPRRSPLGSSSSPGRKSRPASAGVRSSDAPNRSTSATSIPTPMMLMPGTLATAGRRGAGAGGCSERLGAR